MKSLSRRELYDLVWSEPVSRLATRFGLSDVGLKKTCRRHKIPTPGLGYWARIAAGHKVDREAFPALAARDGHLETITFNTLSPEAIAAREVVAARKRETLPADPVNLKLPPFDYLRLTHPLIRGTALTLRAGRLVEGGVIAVAKGSAGSKSHTALSNAQFLCCIRLCTNSRREDCGSSANERETAVNKALRSRA